MKTIKLSKGLVTKIDDIDFDRVSKFHWYASDVKKGSFYAKRINRPQIYLHRFLLGFPKEQVDHINRDTLDNQRENLRTATQTQQNYNSCKRRNTRSKYKGVYYSSRTKRIKRWVTQVKTRNQYRVGYSKTEKEAALVYDFFALQLYGKYARTNFGVKNGLFNFLSS